VDPEYRLEPSDLRRFSRRWPGQKWLSTSGFLNKVDANLKAAMA
jgi:hypothetical protein